MTFARGALLASRYRVQKVLGRGSTGTVYRVHDVLLDQPVAVKVLHEAAAVLDVLVNAADVRMRDPARASSCATSWTAGTCGP